MVLFTIFCPTVAAVLIMLGVPARKTALAASVLTFAAALFLFASLGHSHADFQHVTSFSISPEWRLSFTTGVDGLSVIMVLLASIVTLAAGWFAGMIERHENAFYACLLFISGGATACLAPSAYRLRNSPPALSLSHLGARSLCRSASARCDAARRRIEKIRTVRAFASGHSDAARRRPSLGDSAHRAVTRQHHLC